MPTIRRADQQEAIRDLLRAVPATVVKVHWFASEALGLTILAGKVAVCEQAELFCKDPVP